MVASAKFLFVAVSVVAACGIGCKPDTTERADDQEVHAWCREMEDLGEFTRRSPTFPTEDEMRAGADPEAHFKELHRRAQLVTDTAPGEVADDVKLLFDGNLSEALTSAEREERKAAAARLRQFIDAECGTKVRTEP